LFRPEVEKLYIELCSSHGYKKLQKLTNDTEEVPPDNQSLVVRGGVSLRFLLKLKRVVEAWHPKATTRMVAQSLVKPYSQANECRYFEKMPAEDVGKSTLFVSQMQDSSFCGMVEAVHNHLVNADPGRVFVWLDLFAINQHKVSDEL